MRATGRRAALVAAMVGLLAALTAGVVGPAQITTPLAQAAAQLTDAVTLGAPSTGTVGDGVLPAHPAAARSTGSDRAPVQHVAGWALLVLALLLATAALAVGVRRASCRPALQARRRAAAPRAPPALASC